VGSEKVLKNFSWGSWKVLEKSWIFFVSKRVGTLHFGHRDTLTYDHSHRLSYQHYQSTIVFTFNNISKTTTLICYQLKREEKRITVLVASVLVLILVVVVVVLVYYATLLIGSALYTVYLLLSTF